MRRGRKIALIALGLMLALVPTASAHLYTDYYDWRWLPNEDIWTRVDVWAEAATICNPCPTTARLGNAMTEWNDVNTSLYFRWRGSTASMSRSCSRRKKNQNLVYRAPIDGPDKLLAVTSWCTYEDATYKVTALWGWSIKVDSEESFYTGTGTPSSDQTDWWSVATHELGHGTGWRRHLANGSVGGGGGDVIQVGSFGGGAVFRNAVETVVPPGQTPTDVCPLHTMCGGTPKGETYKRSLELHDEDTFIGAYGMVA